MRRQADHRPPSAGDVELLGLRSSHSHSPSFAPSAASASRSSLRLSACSACVRSVTSCHSSVTPPATGRILTCRIRASVAGGSREVRQRPRTCDPSASRGSRAAARSSPAPAPRSTSERPSARSRGQPQHAFEGVVPERDPAVAVDDATCPDPGSRSPRGGDALLRAGSRERNTRGRRNTAARPRPAATAHIRWSIASTSPTATLAPMQ